MFPGVKRTAFKETPADGMLVGFAQLKVPATLAKPLESMEFAIVWPKVIREAVGARVMVGLALATIRLLVRVIGEM